MNKVILICGKMCSGKTTYAKSLIKLSPTVLLSIDEVTRIFCDSKSSGVAYWEVYNKTQIFLLNKSLEIIESGVDVILDWGFWKQADRQEAMLFYKQNNVLFEWHYVDASNDILLKNLTKRNQEIETDRQSSSYHFSEEVAIKFWNEKFEPPDKNEIDVWYVNRIMSFI